MEIHLIARKCLSSLGKLLIVLSFLVGGSARMAAGTPDPQVPSEPGGDSGDAPTLASGDAGEQSEDLTYVSIDNTEDDDIPHTIMSS